jgi:hypothetical protein
MQTKTAQTMIAQTRAAKLQDTSRYVAICGFYACAALAVYLLTI